MSTSHWEKVPLSKIAEVRLGRQRSPKRAAGPNMRPYMRAANVTWNGISLHDVKQMDFTPAGVRNLCAPARGPAVVRGLRKCVGGRQAGSLERRGSGLLLSRTYVDSGASAGTARAVPASALLQGCADGRVRPGRSWVWESITWAPRRFRIGRFTCRRLTSSGASWRPSTRTSRASTTSPRRWSGCGGT